MQTAVEWFNQQIVDKQNGNGDSRSWDEIFEQAKEMEQGAICLAFLEGQHHSEKLPSQYYIDTYGSKGSDEYKYHEQRRGINVDSFQSEAPQKQDYIIKVTDVTSSQTEISDEEIEEYAKRNAFQYYEFITGAKWYREQLKSRQ